MTITTIDVHVLQSVPPSNINRDETGSPKTATYGGVRRARVSSQAWKRAVRKDFAETLDPASLGTRSRRWVEVLAAAIARLGDDIDAARAEQLAQSALVAAGLLKAEKAGRKAKNEDTAGLPETDYLIFLSALQIEAIARAVIDAERTGGTLTKKELRDLARTEHSVDIALFGRMIADAADLNVDASVQVAHAISVHAVENEADYFTAVDDEAPADNRGAGMIGVVEFNSSTLYRYATIDVRGLIRNLGDETAASAAAGAFVRSFVTSMPTGKQNTFANRTLPAAVVVSIRESAPVNLVGAFEEPVLPQADRSRTAVAVEQLITYSRSLDAAYGRPASATRVLHVGADTEALTQLGTAGTLDDLVAAVEQAVTPR